MAYPEVINKRYEVLDQLGQGGMGAVYRVNDRLTGDIVALKQVVVDAEKLLFNSQGTFADVRMALAQEFKTLASLRHPHIISVLDYGFVDKQPFFTMELLGETQTLVDFARDEPFGSQMELLIQLLQALAYLHRRGIIHRDLKPQNVVVTGGGVKVLDFGLAATREYLETNERGVAGTIAYMAPEILEGAPASEASDLWAVGVMAYEIFARSFPFNTKTAGQLVNDILAKALDLERLDIDHRLRLVLERLLAKDPAARYQDAFEIIEIYAEASGHQQMAYETATVRESFLQAASFVGREDELDQLAAALHDMIELPAGSLWLIGGESGVGKSRLMEELRILALVKGALILRGQGVSEGSSSYDLWQNALRRLALSSEIDDFEAGVLKALVPDIEALLRREIPDPPEADPQAANERLLNVIEALLRRSAAQQPTVVLLDDLQWAGESLEVLKHLQKSDISDLRLLIVGSFRDDEMPSLPTLFPRADLIELKRLSEPAIAELSVSMLGEAGREPSVLDLIQRETEGNAFFIIEVVRTLVETSGGLLEVGSTTVPQSVFAHGMQTVVRHRLSRVPREALPLLRLAAVAGRQLDLKLLEHIEPETNLGEWLLVCEMATVIEIEDNIWRFSHDKLREGLVMEMPAADRQHVHRKIAEAIEHIYPDDATQLARLAYHWDEAYAPVKAERYMVLAGEQALTNGIYRDAVTFLERAVRLQQEDIELTTLHRGHIHRLLGTAYVGLGVMDKSESNFLTAVELLGFPMPNPKQRRFILRLAGQIVRQLLHVLTPRRLERPVRGPRREAVLEATRAYDLLTLSYFYLTQKMKAIYSVMRTANLAARLGPSPEQVRAYGMMVIAVGAGLPPRLGRPLSDAYVRRIEALVPQVESPPALATGLRAVAAYYVGSCQWERAEKAVAQSIQIARDTNNQRLLGDALSNMAGIAYYQGDFERNRQIRQEIYEVGKASGNMQHQIWAVRTFAVYALLKDKPDEALLHMHDLVALHGTMTTQADTIQTQGVRATLYLRINEHEQAWNEAQSIAAILKENPPIAYFQVDSLEVLATIYQHFWERDPANSSYAELMESAVTMLETHAKSYPISQAAALRFRGMYEQLAGNQAAAIEAWRKSIEKAEKLGMRHQLGLTYYEYGRYADKSLLSKAKAIFEEVGHVYDKKRALTAMEEDE